jgi:serine/alanine adding enzyme
MVVVSEINDEGKYLWNEYVLSSNEALVTHLYEFKKVFKESYNLNSIYLGFYDSDKLIGILPSVVIKQPFSKPFLVSLPFFNYSGILRDSNYPEQVILDSLMNFIKDRNLAGFENRTINYTDYLNTNELTLKRELPDSSEKLWKELDAKVRNQIRKAQRSGLVLKWGVDQIDEFYEIYARNMLTLGTPVHSKLFFKSICNELKNYTDVLTVRKDKTAISAMLVIKFKKQLSDPFASSLKKYLSLNPNMLLYWGALQYGCDNNFCEFDFGRSSINSGTYKFKLQWDAEPYNLSYDFYSSDKSRHTSTISSYRGGKAKLFSQMWKMSPYFLSLWLGPKLRRYIP